MPTDQNSISVPNLLRPTRLDKYLAEALAGIQSRAALQRAITSGQVTVNGKRVPAHYFLKGQELIELHLPPAPSQPALAPQSSVKFEVVYECPDYVIINKPAGLVVHPAPNVNEPSLAHGLLARYPELKGIGEDAMRPGLVHRLDREASGLMVVARTQAAFTYLKSAFANRRVDKTYLALVIGKLPNPTGTITFPLARSKRSSGKMAARPTEGPETREAITHYTVIKTFQPASLLEVTIETGRTHQIRAHLAALGHPIVGDNLYRPKNLKFKLTPGRLFLHALKLGFIDPQGVAKAFTQPLPKELNQFLTTLA